MELTWDLDKIYTSFNSPIFIGDVERLECHIKNLNKWAERKLQDTNGAASKIEEFLRMYNEYKSVYSCLSCYAYLIINSDNTNIEAMDVLDNIEDKDLIFLFLHLSILHLDDHNETSRIVGCNI